MPVLARFYGVVIRMLFAPLMGAHFHALYGDDEIMVGIEPVQIIQGDAPAAVKTMVVTWAQEHQGELRMAWNRCAAGLRPATIAPLR